MAENLYNTNDIVFIKQSADSGFLEPVRIVSVHKNNTTWVYEISRQNKGRPEVTFGERIYFPYNTANPIYMTESNLISKSTALTLAKAYLTERLQQLEALESG